MREGAVLGEDAQMERLSTRTGPAGELFDGYLDPKRPHAEAYDEMFAPDSTIRQAYRRLHDSLATARPAELTARSEALDRALVDQGITFSLSGQERPFPLDLMPRVITAAEWSWNVAWCNGFAPLRRSSRTSTATSRSSATGCCRAG
jgi:hypothetical protein